METDYQAGYAEYDEEGQLEEYEDEDCENVEDCRNEEEEPMEQQVEQPIGKDKSESPSTYESISEIVMDKHTSDARAKETLGMMPKPVSGQSGGVEEGCTSADISSLSYNTVPEELYVPPSAMEIEENIPEPEQEEQPGTSSDEVAEEEEPCDCGDNEAGDIRNSRFRMVVRATPVKGQKKMKSSRAQSSNKRTKTPVKRDKSRQKTPVRTNSRASNSKVISQRDMIKPEGQTLFDPDAPRRPRTAFKLFMNEFRSKYAIQYPNISFAEMTDIGAEVWRDMPTDKKAEFQASAKKLQDDYLEQVKEYRSKKQEEKLTKPKTAYQIFMSDYLNKEYEKRKNLKAQSRLSRQDLFMRGVRKWNRLTKTQKRPYEEQSRASKSSHPQKSTIPAVPLPEPVVQIPTQSVPSSSTQQTLPSSPATPSAISDEPKSTKPNNAPVVKSSKAPAKKLKRIEFSEEDEVAQFRPDDTIETWYQASKVN